MIIREVRKDDLQQWVRLRNALWPDSADEHQEELEQFFAGSSIDIVQTYVLESDQKELVGFIELNIRNFVEGSRSSEVPYVEGWYVAPEHRGKGHGVSLMQQAETWAKAKGFTELASDTEIANTKSIAMHKKLGFKETCRIVCFLKDLD